MYRRNIFQGIGAASGTTFAEIGGANPGSTVDSNPKEGGKIESEEITGIELRSLKGQIQSDPKANLLLRKASSLGWKPNWNSITAIRRVVNGNRGQGKFETAAIEFVKRDPASSELKEELFLQWIGNSTINLDKYGGTKEGTSMIRFTDYLTKTSASGSIADEVTIYEVKDGEIYSEAGKAQEANSGMNMDPDPDPGPGDDFCQISVSVYEGDPTTPCWDKLCLILAGLSITTAMAACIASGGILCLASFGIALASFSACLACDKLFTEDVDVLKSWLYTNLANDNPCSAYGKNITQKIDDEPPIILSHDLDLPLAKCEFYNIPTKTDWSSPDC